MLDREAFRRALLNLILNAKQAMPDGGQLTVRTVPQGDTVAIHLIDTGCGMDDRTASKMFEAFFSTKPGGSGLGLPTTQKIIAGHHGRISVESEVGRGTQFTIELPVPARLAGGDDQRAVSSAFAAGEHFGPIARRSELHLRFRRHRRAG